jgi:hypothetical protein
MLLLFKLNKFSVKERQRLKEKATEKKLQEKKNLKKK